MGQSSGQWGNVDEAFAVALRKASDAEQWDLVRELLAERKQHREARAGVPSLDAERAKRGRKR